MEQVRQLNDDLGIPARLGEVGVKAGGIKAMAAAGIQSGNVQVNPRKTTLKDMEAIYREAV